MKEWSCGSGLPTLSFPVSLKLPLTKQLTQSSLTTGELRNIISKLNTVNRSRRIWRWGEGGRGSEDQ